MTLTQYVRGNCPGGLAHPLAHCDVYLTRLGKKIKISSIVPGLDELWAGAEARSGKRNRHNTPSEGCTIARHAEQELAEQESARGGR